MPNSNQSAKKIWAILKSINIPEEATSLSFDRRREHSEVWLAKTWHYLGDISLEIIIYDLLSEPGLIVDYEEEKYALEYFNNIDPPWQLAPRLLKFAAQYDLAFLITTSQSEASIAQKLLNPPQDIMPNEGIQVNIAYHPQLDRILYGDVIQPADGKSGPTFPRPGISSILLSRTHAQELAGILTQLADSYPYVDEFWPDDVPVRPFPIVLSAVEIQEYPVFIEGTQKLVPTNRIFQAPSLSSAPEEYHQLVQMNLYVGDMLTLSSDRSLMVAPDTFSRQLFKVIRCAHKNAKIRLTRKGGTSLSIDTVSPSGFLTDIYYCERTDEIADSETGFLYDFANATGVLWFVSDGEEQRLDVLLRSAVNTYADGRRISQALESIVTNVVQTLSKQSYQHPFLLPPDSLEIETIRGFAQAIAEEFLN